jgi:hypothetical protein
MARAREIFRRPAFQWVLFLGGLVLFYWPFLAYGEQWPQPFTYVYLLTVWALLVLVLFLQSRALRPRLPRNTPAAAQPPAQDSAPHQPPSGSDGA